jgi:hypothetical protein
MHTCWLPKSTPFNRHVARDLALLPHTSRRSNTPSSPGLPRTPHKMAWTSSRSTCLRILVMLATWCCNVDSPPISKMRALFGHLGFHDTCRGVYMYYRGCVSQSVRGCKWGTLADGLLPSCHKDQQASSQLHHFASASSFLSPKALANLFMPWPACIFVLSVSGFSLGLHLRVYPPRYYAVLARGVLVRGGQNKIKLANRKCEWQR